MLDAGGSNWGRMRHYLRTLLCRMSVRAVAKWEEESGAELFEAALAIPILLMLLLGIITFGRAYNECQTITRAARDGARELALTSCATCGENSHSAAYARTNFVEPAMLASNLNPAKISNYTTSYATLDPNDPAPHICGVEIAFKYPYTFSLPFTSVNFSTINLTAKVQMQLENQPDPSACNGSVP